MVLLKRKRKILLLVYLTWLVIDVVRSDPLYSKSCSKGSEHELPCLCPKVNGLKSLCPDVGIRREIKLVKGGNKTIKCHVDKRFGPTFQHYRIHMWWCNHTVDSICYKSHQGPDRSPVMYFKYAESGYNASDLSLTFTITNADKIDEGTYTCAAYTDEEDYTRTTGYDSIYVTVKDGAKPTLRRQPPLSLLKDKGRIVELYCDSLGYPDPNIRWVKDGTPLNKSKSIQNGSQSVLRIENMSKKDEGLYQCIADNSLGFIESEGTQITLNDQEMWMWLMPVCVVILVAIILGFLVVLYWVRRSHEGIGKYGFVDSGVVDGTPSNPHSYSPISTSVDADV